MEKTCSTCAGVYPVEDFPKDKAYPDGRKRQCKHCRNASRREWRRSNPAKHAKESRRWNLRVNYGLEPEDYEEILKSQDHRCAVCLKHETEVPRQRLYVDHCHDSGEVRGLLCSHCNAGIGNLMDSPALLREALRYVEAGI